MNVLLTGEPGIGKTTVCRMVLDYTETNVEGFVTEELRDNGERVGFLVQFQNGSSKVLSHVEYDDPSVGKYGVDRKTMDWVVEQLYQILERQPEGLVIDEIGKMELIHDDFPKVVSEALKSPVDTLATVPTSGPDFVEEIKTREDSSLFELTEENRDEVPETVVRKLGWGNDT
ncbi:MAG: nucleoside-triphosphatase [bacterium]